MPLQSFYHFGQFLTLGGIGSKIIVMTKKYLSIEEVAKKLSLNYKTIFRYIHNKKLEATKIGRWRIDEDELKSFIKRSSNIKK